MASTGFVTLAEAGSLLGVGGEQVRRYVARGLLPATKIANAWVLPAAHVDAFRAGVPRDGRPLSQRAAWDCIVSGDIDLDDPHRYINRGDLSRWKGTSGTITDLIARDDVVVSGIHAALVYGALLDPLPTEAQLYVEPQSPVISGSGLLAGIGLVPDPLGTVIVRSVGAESWNMLRTASSPCGEATRNPGLPPSALYAPPAAVALDLALSPHPRERYAADQVVQSL